MQIYHSIKRLKLNFITVLLSAGIYYVMQDYRVGSNTKVRNIYLLVVKKGHSPKVV